MIPISQVCQKIGVARSTLLYYERIGIVTPERNPENGYRRYSEDDIHALVLVRQLQKAGFSLKEAHAVMKGHLEPDFILARYQVLVRKIQELSAAKELVKSLATHATGNKPDDIEPKDPAPNWHAELEAIAGEAHAKWLTRLGFDEKEQLYIRWLTRNIADPGDYMNDFFQVFEQMERQGPGGRLSTIRAFESIPARHRIRSILDIGCGKGQSSLVLSEISRARITAVDNHQPFLDHLEVCALQQGCNHQISARNLNMGALDQVFSPASFDLVWSEGSAYIQGFSEALSAWKPLIRAEGCLLVSDTVWLTDRPSAACASFFRIEYPRMSTIKARKHESRNLGYELLSHFIQAEDDWLRFYNDMETAVKQVVKEKGKTPACEKMLHEIEIGRIYGKEYGNLYLLLRPVL